MSKEDCTSDLLEKMDGFLEEFGTSNITKKHDIGPAIIKFLSAHPDVIAEYSELSNFIDGLAIHWVQGPNPKVSIYGLDAMMIIAEVLQAKYRHYGANVLPHVLNKLSDTKEAVREKVRAYLLKTVEVGAQNPNHLLEKLIPLITNKNKDVCIESEKAILEVLTFSRGKPLNRQMLIDLLKSQIPMTNLTTRQDCISIVLELTDRLGKRYVVDALESEYPKMYPAQLKRMQQIVEEVKAHTVPEPGTPAPADDDEPDFSTVKKGGGSRQKDSTDKKQGKATPGSVGDVVKGVGELKLTETEKPSKVSSGAKPKETRKKLTSAMAKPRLPSSGLKPSKLGEGAAYGLYSGTVGVEADESWFWSAFKDVPVVEVLTNKEFDNFTKKITTDLNSGPEIWEKKLEALKKLRSLLINVSGFEDDIPQFIKSLAVTFQNCLKDLRSQVVRETCLTLSFICIELKNKMDAHTLDLVLPILMTNVICSAKVIATCSTVTLKFIFTNCHHGRLISTLVQTMLTTKSREIKSLGSECLLTILMNWPVHRLESQISTLQEGLKKGMHDGSSDGRVAARKAYWAFQLHFPEQADLLLSNMDAMLKKQVLAAKLGTEELPVAPKTRQPISTRPAPVRQASAASGSVEDLSEGAGGVQAPRTPTAPRRSSGSAIPVLRRTYMTESSTSSRSSPREQVTSQRSTSAIDLQAVQRAKARQQYAAMARQKVGSGASLPRPKKSEASGPTSGPTTGPTSGSFLTERTGRPRSRGSGITQSQPTSRSGSPSSRLTYPYNQLPVYTNDGRRQPPRSQGTSRETSPNRFGSKSSIHSLFTSKRSTQRPPIQPTNRPVMAHKMLVQSLEAENSTLTDMVSEGVCCLDLSEDLSSLSGTPSDGTPCKRKRVLTFTQLPQTEYLPENPERQSSVEAFLQNLLFFGTVLLLLLFFVFLISTLVFFFG